MNDPSDITAGSPMDRAHEAELVKSGAETLDHLLRATQRLGYLDEIAVARAHIAQLECERDEARASAKALEESEGAAWNSAIKHHEIEVANLRTRLARSAETVTRLRSQLAALRFKESELTDKLAWSEARVAALRAQPCMVEHEPSYTATAFCAKYRRYELCWICKAGACPVAANRRPEVPETNAACQQTWTTDLIVDGHIVHFFCACTCCGRAHEVPLAPITQDDFEWAERARVADARQRALLECARAVSEDMDAEAVGDKERKAHAIRMQRRALAAYLASGGTLGGE